MRAFTKLCLVAVAALLTVSALPGFSQQVKGDSELGLNESLSFPNQSGGEVTIMSTVSYGYYFRTTDLVGFDDTAVVSGTTNSLSTVDYIQGRYRHLFPMKSNPKAFPFVGVQAGILATAASGSTSTNNFVSNFEAGYKYYVSPKTAFEVAYNLQYINETGGTFSSDSMNVITFGFTYNFGGPKSKH